MPCAQRLPFRLLVGSLLVATRTASEAVAETDVAASGAVAMRVVDAGGTPQPGAELSLFGYDRDWRCWRSLGREARTDSKGAASFEGLSKDEAYVVRASAGNLLGLHTALTLGESEHRDVTIKVEQQVQTAITIRDEQGKPIAGAAIWAIEHTGSNGTTALTAHSLPELGFVAEPSNDRGELALPALPPGTLKFRVLHPRYAPCELENVAVGSSAGPVAVLGDGATVRLRIEAEDQSTIEACVIDMRHSPFQHASTLIGQLPVPIRNGLAEFTVAPGNYEWLRLTHPDYALTPIYSARYGKSVYEKSESMDLSPGENEFTFEIRRKSKVRGRVVDEKTLRPIADLSMEGRLHAGAPSGPFARFANEWTHIGWGETNEQGEYEMELAAGRARVMFQGRGRVAKPNWHEIDVAADGSTTVPDFQISQMPAVRGVVLNQDGEPVRNAVVRFRGSILVAAEPVASDEQGRFELSPPWIPEDLQTEEPLPVQSMVAFHPHQRLYAQADVRWDDVASLDNVVLKLEPDEGEPLATRIKSDLTPWQRGEITAEEKHEMAAISLAGKQPPELDGAHWLNTDGRHLTLADLRGKYVLLQFWTTWCGPCHADMPSIRLLDKLYRDKGLVVIGIHDNSMPLAAIQEDVAKEKLTYPIVVDHPDGRILASYEKHGVNGYPSYMLLGPDGTVITDRTVPGPQLRSFKIEIIRDLLLEQL